MAVLMTAATKFDLLTFGKEIAGFFKLFVLRAVVIA